MAKNQSRRFNVLLNGVKRGSPSHLERLGEEWPTDLDQACQAFSVLLNHLKLEDVPALHKWNICGIESEDEVAHVKRRTASQAILSGLTEMITSDDTTKARVLEVMQPYLPGFIAWTTFYARRSASLYFEPYKAYAGTYHACWIFRRLMEYGLKDQPDNPCLPQLVESALNLWMWDPLDIPEPASSMVPAISASHYMRFIEPTNHLLLLCTMHSGALRIAIDRINTLKKKERREHQLTHSFNFRCDQWANTFGKDKEGGDSPTAALWTILHVYESLSSGSVVLQKNLDKTPFLSKALALVAEVTLVWPNTGKLCLAVEVVNLLFPPQSLNAFAMTHQVPGLIKAGLLDIIASGHLVPDIKWSGGNPCGAFIVWFITLLKALAANPDWKKFQDVVSDLRNAYADAPPRNEVPLCDNLHHSTTSQQVVLRDAKGVQCSWCHTTVYCSRECQQKDWDLFHKSECTASRVQRIDRQIHGGWVSHRTRTLFLICLRGLLLRPGMPYIKDPLIIPWFDLRTYPHTMLQFEVEEMRSQETECGEVPFGDARSNAILDHFVENGGKVRLVGFIAELGEYHVFALAWFRRVELGQRTGPRMWHSIVRPLGVHVRVLKRPWP